jgi:hypothetical protein
MILYHFTNPVNIAGIAIRGLEPGGDDPFMTKGKPVVWLTEAPDTAMTEQQAEQFAIRGCVRAAGSSWLTGKGDDSLIRLTVSLEPNSSRLAHYLTWLDRECRKDGFDPVRARSRLVLEIAEQWWIYFGTIPPSKIIDGPNIDLELRAGEAAQNLAWPEAVPALAAFAAELRAETMR